MTTTRINQIEKRIHKIHEEIANVGDIRPGSMTQQSRGSKGETYGQYWSVSYTFKKRGHTDYVPSRAAEQVRAETENYKRLRELIEEWTELGIELSKLRIKEIPSS